ncbi:MAG: hypothetical protein ACI4HI_03645 [Lachnospiraceae bacterium]
MKKKIFALVMTVVFLIGCLSGCGEKTNESTETASTDKKEESTETASEDVSETLQRLRESGTITIAGSGTALFGFKESGTNELKGIY